MAMSKSRILAWAKLGDGFNNVIQGIENRIGYLPQERLHLFNCLGVAVSVEILLEGKICRNRIAWICARNQLVTPRANDVPDQ